MNVFLIIIPSNKEKMSLKFARQWVNVYFFLEVTWIVFWFATMLAYQLGLGEDGAAYRLDNALEAFHLVLLPTVAYTLRDPGWDALLGYIAVIITDIAIVLEVSLHTPEIAKEIHWAFGTALTTAAYGLFISVLMLCWFFYVWFNRIKFRKQGSTEELEPLEGTPSRGKFNKTGSALDSLDLARQTHIRFKAK